MADRQPNVIHISRYLENFEFSKLFIQEFGWSNPTTQRETVLDIDGIEYRRKQIAQQKAVVFEVLSEKMPDSKTRRKIFDVTSKIAHENLIIFVSENRQQSLWYWGKRDGKKVFPREQMFNRGQPTDLILSKIIPLQIDLSEYDEDGNVALTEITEKLKKALDVETVTRKFFGEFYDQHLAFIDLIEGISDEKQKRWYASILLNRLMFIYFLQKKGFLNNADFDYLQKKLSQSQAKGSDLFYKDFLTTLFFVGFAKPENERQPEEKAQLGAVPYLNGGLFLRHHIEREDVNPHIQIPDKAFENILTLFTRYSWNLDDTPGGNPNEINPDVLGYIFEKYINQKAFGAYYTRTEITEYLCEQTIAKLILDRINSLAAPKGNPTQTSLIPQERTSFFTDYKFESIEELLFNLDDYLCSILLDKILPELRLLDPACGSGAFLVAAMKTLIKVYTAITGKIDFSVNTSLKEKLEKIRREHHGEINYYIKKRIITDNLFGVDLMEEATEIAKLRLFLSLVASAKTLAQLEPLPNIDFNILAGNSLIGILKVNAESFDKLQGNESQAYLFGEEVSQNYQKILDNKKKSIALYKEHSFKLEEDEGGEQTDRLSFLRDDIERIRRESQPKLDELLLGDFKDLKIKVEEAKWDSHKNGLGKPEKREITLSDIEKLDPFHWGFEFPEVFDSDGFDAIITNPPWEIFKPQAKEFFLEFSDVVMKNKMTIQDFEKEQTKLLQNKEIRKAWLQYLSRFPHLSLYYRGAGQYKNQIAVVNGKKQGTDINLYKLFLEQCFNLLAKNGRCGIIVQGGVYSDLGAKQLREMLFSGSKIDAMFGLSNEKFIFDNVDHRQTFCILVFEKGGITKKFDAAFRINPREAISKDTVDRFLRSPKEHIQISVDLIRKFSPDSLSVMEFKSEIDIRIVEKMLRYQLLSESLNDRWNFALTREFDMTNDKNLFKTRYAEGRLPLFEGKMIHQFTHKFSEPRYWVETLEGRQSLLGRKEDNGQVLDYQQIRLGMRAVGRNTDSRTLIVSGIPPAAFCGNSVLVLKRTFDSSGLVSNKIVAYLIAVLNSLTVDYYIRQVVSANLNMFYIYQLPVPRLVESDAEFNPIVERAAKLICTTPEFDDLAAEVGLESHVNGITDEAERSKLRAELDALIAHLYGLTEDEFSYILTTFPLVPDAVKEATIEAFRTFAPHPDDKQILAQIKEGENNYLEFKVAAYWNEKKGKKDESMKLNITEAVAAFLNSTEGGAILIGVEDNKNIIGLADDFRAANAQKNNQDGYSLLLREIIRSNCGLIDSAKVCEFSFHVLEGKEICRIRVTPSSEPVYHKGDFIIRDGDGKRKLPTNQAIEYIQKRWK